MASDEMKKGGSPNPFQTYDEAFTPNMQKPHQTFSASAVSGKKDQESRIASSNLSPTPVTLPPHLFIPSDAQSVDIRTLANVPPATSVDLLVFEGRQGGITKFINYSIFFDALLFNLIEMVPLVNGKRVFPFHGDPSRNFKMGLGTGSDLSNANLISCQLDLQPRDTLVWRFTNNDTVAVAAGVRMVGYFDQSTIRKQGRFGG